MVVGSIPTVGACLPRQQRARIAPLAQWIARWTSNPKVAGSSPAGGMALAAVAARSANRARLAQSVARGSHNPKVVSSILAPRSFVLLAAGGDRMAEWSKAPDSRMRSFGQ